MVVRTRIAAVASVVPDRVRTSSEIEAIVRRNSPNVKFMPGTIEMITGIRQRHYADDAINTSDLAAGACERVLAKTGTQRCAVDLLIFASAGQDLMEPATAHIIQSKLGTTAAVMDVKNACNSFINGVQVAESLLMSGQYRKILIATGEKPSVGIKWQVADKTDLRLSFPGYTFGDAGAAALLEPSHDESGIYYRKFTADSTHWDIGTLPGGGSMHPRGEEFSYFRGDGAALKDAFFELGPRFLQSALEETGTSIDTFARILVHQVSLPFLDLLLQVCGIPREKVVITLPEYGNMAAASLPLAFDLAERRGEIRRGDHVLFIGLAGGISLGILMVRY